MPFSEQIKVRVKESAAFRCCRCQHIGVDVHHILPQKDGGPDDIENAAPLCQSCHDQFGDNPSKRKEITQMRDWWYSRVKEKYQGGDWTLLSTIDAKLAAIQEGQGRSGTDLDELKIALKQLSLETIDAVTPETANDVASGIAGGITLNSEWKCPKCGRSIAVGVLVGGPPKCPTDGSTMNRLVVATRSGRREEDDRRVAERGPDCDRIEEFTSMLMEDVAHSMVQAGLPKNSRTFNYSVDEAQHRMQVVAESWNAVTSLDPSGELLRLCGEAHHGMASLGGEVIASGDEGPNLGEIDKYRELVGRKVVEIRKIVSEYRLGER